MKIATSGLSNEIYAGNTKKDKKGREVWTKKENVTKQAIIAVFEHMYNKAKRGNNEEFIFEGFGKLTFKLEKNE